jgi:hypothetical protein
VKLSGNALAKYTYDAASDEDDRPGRNRGGCVPPPGAGQLGTVKQRRQAGFAALCGGSLVMLANRWPSPLPNSPMTKTTGWLTTYLTVMVAALPDAASNAATAAITRRIPPVHVVNAALARHRTRTATRAVLPEKS